MTDPRVSRLAAVILDYTTRVSEGDTVVIRGEVLGEPILNELYRGALERGAHPYMDLWLPNQHEIFFRHAQDHQLDYVSPEIKKFFEEYDVMIRVDAQANTKARSSIDPAKQSRHEAAYKDVMVNYLQRSSTGEFRWCRSLFGRLTLPAACRASACAMYA